MRSNFDFNLFPGIVFCCGESGGGPESVYRLFRGQKSEQRLIKISKKIEKMKTFQIFVFVRQNSMSSEPKFAKTGRCIAKVTKSRLLLQFWESRETVYSKI